MDFKKGGPKIRIEDAEKSLEMIGSIDKVQVAHGCAHLISEVLDIAKKQMSSRKAQAVVISTFSNPSVNTHPTKEHLEGGMILTTEASEGASDGEIHSNLVDFNFLANFTGFSDLNYFFGGGGKIPADATILRPGAHDSDEFPLMGAQDFLQGENVGVLQ